MKVLLVKPDERAKIVDIESGLKSLQKMVGGYIQAIYPFPDPVAIICNEEGKIIGLPLNRELRDEDGRIYDIIAGDFLLVGVGEEDFGSLTEEEIEEYTDIFGGPKLFIRDPITSEIVVKEVT